MEKINFLLVLILFSVIILGVAVTRPARTQETTDNWIAVNPPHFTGKFEDFFHPEKTVFPYQGNFTAEVNVSATGLYGFEYKLNWNNTLLNVTDYVVLTPWDEGNYSVVDEFADLGDGQTQHYVTVEANQTAGAAPFTGETTICQYHFQVEYQPYFPAPDAYCNLDLKECSFYDIDGQSIPLNVHDGEYTILSERVPVIHVEPINWTLGVGSNCTVHVRIGNVTGGYFVDGYDFQLLYNSSVLHGVSVELPSGHFLEPEDPDKIFIAKQLIDDNFNATHGQVWLAATLLDPEEPRNGSGVVAKMTFNITGLGTGSPFHFYQPHYPFPAKLAQRKKYGKVFPVPCTVTLASIEVPPEEGEGTHWPLPMEYIAAAVIIVILFGSIALHYVRKREG